jgi:hypothetical protein
MHFCFDEIMLHRCLKGKILLQLTKAFESIEEEDTMSKQGVWQLQRLIMSYSQTGGSSRGLR